MKGFSNTLLAKGSQIPMPFYPSSTWHLLMDFSAGFKNELIEHGQLAWIEVEARPTIKTEGIEHGQHGCVEV